MQIKNAKDYYQFECKGGFGANWHVALCFMLPDSILEKSKISLMVADRISPLLRIVLIYSYCSFVTGFLTNLSRFSILEKSHSLSFQNTLNFVRPGTALLLIK